MNDHTKPISTFDEICRLTIDTMRKMELASAADIASKEKVERTYAGDVLRLKYLAPEIVTMIMNGTQPRTLKVSQLLRQQLPLDWEAQKRLLNIA